ncbi:MAG: AAA family ATPase [Verrucomicrobiota bacterium]|nr:AAA family ATPase [Verrucomicrobiota bacterium]
MIFIDEIDAVGRSRFSGIGGGHDEREQTLNALLVELDGFKPSTNVIVIAATNRPDVLDPALLRPGRFDRRINIDLPDLKGRENILQVHAKGIKLSDKANLNTIARGTPGFSGADLANLLNEAALIAAKANLKAITNIEMEEARDKVRWGKERKSRKISDKDRKVTAYHEAGHALAGLYSKDATPLHKVTIIPRGNAYLGATMHLPEEDQYTQNYSQLTDELIVLLGGRAAEVVMLDDITSGASADIAQATNIAKQMVCHWGMSKKLGLINYGAREGHIYIGRDITRSEDYSEETAREIDLEIKEIIHTASDKAIKIMKDHCDELELFATTLLKKETMTSDEIKKLIGMKIQKSTTKKKTTKKGSKKKKTASPKKVTEKKKEK